MDNQPELRFIRVMENISHHFGFLSKRGFQLVSILFVDDTYEDWQAIIAIEECIIKIYRENEKVDLMLSIPQLYDAIGQLKLSDLIYGISEAEDFSLSAQESPMDEAASLLRIAQLLEKYIGTVLEKIRNMLDLLSLDKPPAPSSRRAQMFPHN